MIAVEIRMRPSVFETSGEGLSVQLTKSARRSEKSHLLVEHSSSWKSVNVMRASLFDVSRTLARVERLLEEWFAAHGRDLPWRRTRDPYAILVSEVMLQQTQVDRVVPRYLAWLERWPTVEALADASTADVIREWQGLGYNRRGVALHRAARHVAELGWPEDLTELPGVGPYTAAAIRCFAQGDDVLPVDVNVERVQRRTGHAFPSSSTQALMDLGATICLARAPRCDACPLATACPSRGIREEPARKQGPFEGSFRQRRAATLRVVADASRELAELDDEAVRSLERDGLVVVAGGFVTLPT
jgi:A/G-specific adenine glycosylase